MALGAGNVLLLVGSLLAATAALFWPNIEQAYLAYHHSQRGPSNSANVAAGKCPLVRVWCVLSTSALLCFFCSHNTTWPCSHTFSFHCPWRSQGYEGPMPTKHPPVPGSSNKLKQEPSAAAAAAALHQKPTLVTFANANIWTANVKVGSYSESVGQGLVLLHPVLCWHSLLPPRGHLHSPWPPCSFLSSTHSQTYTHALTHLHALTNRRHGQ